MSNLQPHLTSVLAERHLTQREFARLAGIAQATVHKLVSFHSPSRPLATTCIKIASALGVEKEMILELAGYVTEG